MNKFYARFLTLVCILFSIATSAQTIPVFEPQGDNNTAATASPIVGNQVKLEGYIYLEGDIDFYSFSAIAGDRVYAALMTATNAGSSNSVMSIIATDGVTVLEVDDDNGTFAPFSSSIAGTVIPTTGTYYIKIKESATATIRPYELYFRLQSGTPTAEVEPNDLSSSANVLPANGWMSGVRTPALASEQDWFAITLTAGQSVFISLDLDPERDGTTWNGRVAFGLLGDAGDQLVFADDPGTSEGVNPTIPSEALFFTVKDAGTYYVYVDGSGAVGGPTATYQLSVSKFAATTGYVNYAFEGEPTPIGPTTGSTVSTITISDSKMIRDLQVRVNLNHALMADIDATLTSPNGNVIHLFSDIGATAISGQTQMDLFFDDYNAIPPSNSIMKGVGLQPELTAKLDLFRGMNTAGVWKLTLYDDLNNAAGGILNGWSLSVLEEINPVPSGAILLVNEDFETTDGGFTHSGAQDEFEWGTPATIATATPNPVVAFNTANSGVKCWKIDLDNTYNINANEILESPTYNLSGVTGTIYVSWAMRYQLESATFDKLEIYAEEVGGTGLKKSLFIWYGGTMTAQIGNPSLNIPMSAGWGTFYGDLSAFAGKSVRFKVKFTTDNTINFAGIGIDDLKIFVPPCSISTVAFSNQGICNDNETPLDGTDDFYTADVTVTYANAPVTGNLRLEQSGAVLDVVTIPVSSLTGASYTFTAVRLKSNGLANAVQASFTATSCTQTANAPTVASCSATPCTITCPANITTAADPNQCGKVVTYTAPVTTGTCGTVTSLPASGSFFPIGVTTVTVLSTSGSTCTFTVTVTDTQFPVITCPANIIVSNDAGQCGAIVTYAAPVATDNCPLQTITPLTVTQSSSTSITPSNSVSCNNGSGHTANSYYRVYDLAPMSLVGPFTISTVTFGIESANSPSGTQLVDVKLYTLSGAFIRANMTLVGSQTYSIPNQAATLFTANLTLPATVPANAKLVLEIFTPEGRPASNLFYMGGNTSPETDPGYIVAPDCGVTEPILLASVGYPNMHIVLNATGTVTGPSNITSIPASGSFFPKGITTVTSTVIDASGNSANCTFTVTVNDTQAPVITCPANKIVTTTAGQCGAIVTFTAPVISDNCPGSSVISTPASGSFFPKGITTVTSVATDATGNTSSCTFTITVNDAQVPVITCPANIIVPANTGQCGAIVTYTTPTATDNCPGVTIVSLPASGSVFPNGITKVTATATDASGNISTCTFTITVNDNQVPVITCPANIIVSNQPGQCGAIVTYTTPVVSDNCPGVTVVSVPASGSFFAKGITTVTSTATDAAGNIATCTFTVRVNDTQAPAIACNSNIIVSNTTGQCGAIVSYAAVTATDNCSGVTVVSSPASGSFFAKGTTTVLSTATDASGNITTCSFTVTVNDTQVPVITCPANIIVPATASQCGAIVNYTAPVATDNCTGVTVVSTPASGSFFAKGTTTVISTATDVAGNITTCSFTITVNDLQAPSITCPANIIVANTSNQCGAIVNFAAPVVSDNCPGVSVVSVPASGSFFAKGITTVTSTATDAAGNIATCTFTVRVNDTQAPSITCPANKIVTATVDQCGAIVTYTSPVASDNCSGVTVISSPASGSFFPTGLTTVTSTATDAAGNTTSCTFTVRVFDLQSPVITCPANIIVSNTSNQCGAIVNYTVAVTDNCPGATVISFPASGSFFPKGTTTVFSTAIDASGNFSFCSFTVRVNDTQPPAITCPENIIVSNDANLCGAVVTYATPIASDNCSGVSVVSSPASGSFFPTGLTTVTSVATDASGNTASCTFTVQVNDSEAPVIICPANIVVPNTMGECGAVVTFNSIATDNCEGVTIISSPASGSFFPNGTTTVVSTATDVSGNISTCSFTVTVNDAQAPAITCPENIIVANDLNQCGAMVPFEVTATDNCEGVTVVSSSLAGSLFPIGVTTVTSTATDASGNISTCSFTITVIDEQAPVITCPENIVVANDPDQCGAIVTFATIAQDNCTGTTVVSSPASGSFFPVGTTTVTTTATDLAGNISTCTFTIKVNDTQPPVITCPANIVTTSTAGQCSRVVDFAIVATDNCPELTVVSSPASGSAFPIGVTTVTSTATDAAGNTASCTFTVTVTDTELPIISTQPTDDTVCAGNAAVFSIVASNAATYQWQVNSGNGFADIDGETDETLTVNNVTATMNGDVYRVLVKGPCTTVTSAEVNLVANVLPSVTITAFPRTMLKPGQTTTIRAHFVGQPGNFAWFHNGIPAGSGVQSYRANLNVDSLGTYKVIFTDMNGCTATSNELAITADPSEDLFVYPNPNRGQFLVRVYSATLPAQRILNIYNAAGALVYRRSFTMNSPYEGTEVDIRKFAAGIYTVALVDADGKTVGAKKVIYLH